MSTKDQHEDNSDVTDSDDTDYVPDSEESEEEEPEQTVPKDELTALAKESGPLHASDDTRKRTRASHLQSLTADQHNDNAYAEQEESEDQRAKKQARVDAIWEQMKQQQTVKPVARPSGAAVGGQAEAGMVTVVKEYVFAGEKVLVEERVQASAGKAQATTDKPQASAAKASVTAGQPQASSSAASSAASASSKADLLLMAKPSASPPATTSKPLLKRATTTTTTTTTTTARKSRLESLAMELQTGKPQKLTTLEKSKLDWNKFVEREEGLRDDLKQHGKDGYLDRMEFLQRASEKETEAAVRARQQSRNK